MEKILKVILGIVFWIFLLYWFGQWHEKCTTEATDKIKNISTGLNNSDPEKRISVIDSLIKLDNDNIMGREAVVAELALLSSNDNSKYVRFKAADGVIEICKRQKYESSAVSTKYVVWASFAFLKEDNYENRATGIGNILAAFKYKEMYVKPWRINKNEKELWFLVKEELTKIANTDPEPIVRKLAKNTLTALREYSPSKV
ncbi:hypothetical protein [Spirosoma arcticum]